jgi:hypothetical protein
VLHYLPGGFRWLKRNVRQDVVDYFDAFAAQLEEKLLQEINVAAVTVLQKSAVIEAAEPALA